MVPWVRKGGALERAHSSYPGSNLGGDVTCGASLQLLFFLDLRSFTSDTPIPVLPGVVALDPHLSMICFRAGCLLERSSPNLWPGFKSRRRRHMWVGFVVGSLLCCESLFFGYFSNAFATVAFNFPSIIIFLT